MAISGSMMISVALALALSSNGAVARIPKTVRTVSRDCAVAPRSCMVGPQLSDEAAFRVSSGSAPGYDRKMDAYRLDPRPCNLGAFRCPKRGREVFRLGEPVEQTLMRAFGIDGVLPD